jgi:hypothetical protein
MSKRNTLRFAPAGALLLLALLAQPALAVDFEVTITNLTANQTFTPIVVASHRPANLIFGLGRPASTELEALAEGGETAPLLSLLQASPLVSEAKSTGAPLMPGASVTVMISANGGSRRLSLGSMLVPTNDGFFALQNVMLDPAQGRAELYAPAYDAGSEANDERCASIPGPPTVCQGEGTNPSRAGAEGYVHIHRGIHGIADLADETFDWRNPVARVVVQRVH